MEKPHGFLALDKARRSELARMGGKAAHAKGTAHQWTSQEAREASKKGHDSRRRKARERHPPLPDMETT